MIAHVKSQKYKPLYKPNQITHGGGQVLIVTGWSDRKHVAKQLKPNQYLAIGQLYSPTRGINLLIRNILYNPFITEIVGLEATKNDINSGSIRCLRDFFVYGFDIGRSPDTGNDVWMIKSKVTGYVDITINQSDLIKLRENVRFTLVKSIDELKKFLNEYQPKSINPWGIPTKYHYLKPQPSTLPGETYVHRVEGATIAETWVKIIHRIKTLGVIRPTGYDGKWQELINLVSVVTDEPDDYYIPDWVPVTREFLQEYIPQVVEDAPYIEGIKYTYGQRLRSWFQVDQVEQVIAKLIGEIDAASAVMSLWDVNDHVKGGSPCLNHIWFRVVDGVLSMTALFRSNDMFSAWVSNAMGLRALQKHVRDEIAKRSEYDLKLGNLITISQSAHIYDDCWESADSLIKNQYRDICNKQRNYSDSSGNFMVEWVNGKILVTQSSPKTDEVVKEYSNRKALFLVREIATANPSINPEHIGYLGLELAKCEMLKDNYIQDS